MLLLARRTPSATLRRMRSIVAVVVAMSFAFLPQVVGFGLSGIGLRPAINGALVPRASAAALEQTIGWEGKQQSRNWRRRAQEISCRVSSPRRYGSADWFSNIQNLPKSRLLYNIKGHLFYNTAFAFAVSLVHLLTPQHIIDDLHVSAIPHSIMSGALGLLLVFRTNAAYNRFWEARKIWGGLINTCRNIARLGAVALGPDSAEWLEIKEYIRMFPFLLKQHLQDVRVDEELDWVSLPPADIIRLQEDPNPPMFALQKITEILAGAYADGGAGQSMGGRVPDLTSVTYRMEIERHLSSLMDALGKCERILTTPVPRGYSRHTSRFLTVYGFTLPIVLVPHTELFTAPVVAAVCWGLFSIEEIAYFIEQPFDPEYRQLDLMGFSEKVARDIERMTVSSSLGGGGGEGSSSSPRLPVAAATGVTAAVHGDGLVQSSYEPKLQELNLEVPLTEVNGGSASNFVNGHAASEIKGHNGFGRKGWGIGGGRAGSGHLDVVRSGGEEDRAEAEEGKRSKVDGLLQSWQGNRDDDPV